MDKPTRRLEFETMLLARHGYFYSARPPGPDGTLDKSAYVLLSRIQLDGPMSISQLSNALGLDVSTLNRQTAAMLRTGLVDRIPDPDGGIARKFQITAKGHRLVDAHRAENNRGLDKILADWTPEQVAEFADMLTRFNQDIERLQERPWPRPRSSDTRPAKSLGMRKSNSHPVT